MSESNSESTGQVKACASGVTNPAKIEAVARAIHDTAVRENGACMEDEWDLLEDEDRDGFRRDAEAAIRRADAWEAAQQGNGSQQREQQGDSQTVTQPGTHVWPDGSVSRSEAQQPDPLERERFSHSGDGLRRFRKFLQAHGYHYGDDAASNALVGYELARASSPAASQGAQEPWTWQGDYCGQVEVQAK